MISLSKAKKIYRRVSQELNRSNPARIGAQKGVDLTFQEQIIIKALQKRFNALYGQIQEKQEQEKEEDTNYFEVGSYFVQYKDYNQEIVNERMMIGDMIKFPIALKQEDRTILGSVFQIKNIVPLMKEVSNQYGFERTIFYTKEQWEKEQEKRTRYQPKTQNTNIYPSQQVFKKLGFTDNFDDFKAIKKFYHKLAMKYHPDVSKEPNAEKIFKILTEAYSKLENNKGKTSVDEYPFVITDYRIDYERKFENYNSIAFRDNMYHRKYRFLSPNDMDKTIGKLEKNKKTRIQITKEGFDLLNSGKTIDIWKFSEPKKEAVMPEYETFEITSMKSFLKDHKGLSIRSFEQREKSIIELIEKELSKVNKEREKQGYLIDKELRRMLTYTGSMDDYMKYVIDFIKGAIEYENIRQGNRINSSLYGQTGTLSFYSPVLYEIGKSSYKQIFAISRKWNKEYNKWFFPIYSPDRLNDKEINAIATSETVQTQTTITDNGIKTSVEVYFKKKDDAIDRTFAKIEDHDPILIRELDDNQLYISKADKIERYSADFTHGIDLLDYQHKDNNNFIDVIDSILKDKTLNWSAESDTRDYVLLLNWSLIIEKEDNIVSLMKRIRKVFGNINFKLSNNGLDIRLDSDQNRIKADYIDDFIVHMYKKISRTRAKDYLVDYKELFKDQPNIIKALESKDKAKKKKENEEQSKKKEREQQVQSMFKDYMDEQTIEGLKAPPRCYIALEKTTTITLINKNLQSYNIDLATRVSYRGRSKYFYLSSFYLNDKDGKFSGFNLFQECKDINPMYFKGNVRTKLPVFLFTKGNILKYGASLVIWYLKQFGFDIKANFNMPIRTEYSRTNMNVLPIGSFKGLKSLPKSQQKRWKEEYEQLNKDLK